MTFFYDPRISTHAYPRISTHAICVGGVPLYVSILPFLFPFILFLFLFFIFIFFSNYRLCFHNDHQATKKSAGGYVSLKSISEFNKMKKLTMSWRLIAIAVQGSSIVESVHKHSSYNLWCRKLTLKSSGFKIASLVFMIINVFVLFGLGLSYVCWWVCFWNVVCFFFFVCLFFVRLFFLEFSTKNLDEEYATK